MLVLFKIYLNTFYHKCLNMCFRHLTSELNEIIKMIDALMAGEFERCSSADLNRPLVETESEVLEKVSFYIIFLDSI